MNLSYLQEFLSTSFTSEARSSWGIYIGFTLSVHRSARLAICLSVDEFVSAL